MGLRMDAQLVPRRLGKIDLVVFRRLLDVRERQIAVFVGDAHHLIEPRDSVPDMPRIRQRLFSLLWKSKYGLRQVTLHRKAPVLFMRLPRCCSHLFEPSSAQSMLASAAWTKGVTTSHPQPGTQGRPRRCKICPRLSPDLYAY